MCKCYKECHASLYAFDGMFSSNYNKSIVFILKKVLLHELIKCNTPVNKINGIINVYNYSDPNNRDNIFDYRNITTKMKIKNEKKRKRQRKAPW